MIAFGERTKDSRLQDIFFSGKALSFLRKQCVQQENGHGTILTMKNLDKRQLICAHAFGKGAKTFSSGFQNLFIPHLVLLTDVSSLAMQRDFQTDNLPKEVEQLILPMLGIWAGDRIVFSGDYTEVDDYKETDEDNEIFEDISDKIALAVWTRAWNMSTQQTETEMLKQNVREFLRTQEGGTCSTLEPVFEAMERKRVRNEDEEPPKCAKKVCN